METGIGEEELTEKYGWNGKKEDVMDLLKITSDQAYSQIKKLMAEGKLVQNQKGKYANYKLKD